MLSKTSAQHTVTGISESKSIPKNHSQSSRSGNVAISSRSLRTL
jgi:hypothetical protein